MFGKANTTAVQLAAVAGNGNTEGFILNGISNLDNTGFFVSEAGDVDGDGMDDIIIGARGDNPGTGGNTGSAYVVFGKAGGAAINLSTLEQPANTAGIVLNGVSGGDNTGDAVSGGGDVNGDGFDDIIVGAYGDNSNAGTAYVVFGGNLTGAATQIGTSGADNNLPGTSGNDGIFAGAGDDTVQSSAGTDRITGGQGADHFDFLDVTGTTTLVDFSRIEGDKMDVSVFNFANFAALQATFSPSGSGVGLNTLIELDGDTDVVVLGVRTSELIASDFIL